MAGEEDYGGGDYGRQLMETFNGFLGRGELEEE